MEIWKAALKTEVDGATPELREAARDYCFTNGRIGLGWGVGDLLEGTALPSDYADAVRANARLLRDEWDWNLNSCLTNHDRFSSPERLGDLVWSRSTVSGYWLGKIVGPWLYDRDPILTGYDLNQWRLCNWFNVGDSANVPGHVRNQFAGRGGSFTRMVAGGETLKWLSAVIYANLSGEAIGINPPQNADVMTNVGHDDLEDVVGLYLQQAKNWYIVPTTAKHSTATSEFTLRNEAGETAWLQVKSGHARMPDVTEIPDGVDRFFVFETTPSFAISAVPTEIRERLEVILPDQLLEWANQHRTMLPQPVRLLLELADRNL
jgi:hypothetical protein